MSNAGGYGMNRGLGNDGGLSRRRVGRLGRSGRLGLAGTAGTVLLVAGIAAGPGMLDARSATPAGQIERVSVTGSGGERNAREDSGSSLACSALNDRRCTKRTLSDDGTKVVYPSAAANLADGDANGRTDIFPTTLP